VAITSLPPDGELRIGSVILADGRRILSDYGSYEPMAWVTTQPVADAGMVWSALSDAHDQTGLVPFLLAGLPGAPERPWDTRDFGEPADVAWLGHMDAAELLEEMWEGHLPTEYEDQELGAPFTAMRAPFSRQFPGLAPAEDQHLSQAQRQQVLHALLPARIGLVAARRSADVLPLVGLPMTDQFDNALPVAAVLRSWEDRFGARLLQVGFADIWLLAERPPQTVEDAQLLAAEMFAFCDEYGNGLHDIPGITAALMSSPIWAFWWD
jgi:hypothetical protein